MIKILSPFLVFILVSSASTLSWAESDYVSGPRNFVSGDLGIYSPGANVIVGNRDNGNTAAVSFADSGPLGVGVDYDYMYKSDLSFGGFMRYYSVSTSIANASIKNSIFSIGPDLRGYLQSANWIGFFSTGLGYTSYTYNDNANLTINSSVAIMLSIGFLYKCTDLISVGFQNLKLYGLTSAINGMPVNDYMFTARFALAK